MKKVFIFILYTILYFACSTKVNKAPNRFYHSLNTKYNVLFNGKESFKEGEYKLKQAYYEDYDKILPVYIFPDEEISKEIIPEMNIAIEKATKGINRHSMYIKKKERNKYIDECYYLMANAHLFKREFSKSIEVFTYISKAYKKEEIAYMSDLGIVKTYLELNQKDEANQLLRKMGEEKKLPTQVKANYHALFAEYYIREKNFSLAITELKEALENTKIKKEKIRYNFIIAQLYEEMGNDNFAVEFYDKVLELKPPFEIAFQAKTKKAFVSLSTKNLAEIEEELKKLLVKSPSGNSKSIIYLALCELELRKANQPASLNYLKLAEEEAEDNKTKKKVYLKFAHVYYDDKDFLNAQKYYDKAIQVIPKNDELYESILAKRNSLTRLANNLKIIQFEDSVQRIARLSEDERLKFIEEIIESKKNQVTPESTPTASENVSMSANSDWYFTNENTRNFGYKEFSKIWGKRTLEDNWRRKNKMIGSFGNEDLVESINLSDEELKENTIQSYLSALPLSEEKLAASHQKKLNAHYDLGIVYMEQLQEYDLSVDHFIVVVDEYDTSKYDPSSLYFLYTIYNKQNQSELANKYKNKILSKYPDSEYAQVIKNPNYFIEKQKAAEKIFPYYENTYQLYLSKDYFGARENIKSVDSLFPVNIIKPKFELLEALCIGKLYGIDEFSKALKNVESKYKNSEESKEATRILSVLQNVSMANVINENNDFTYDVYAEHQIIILIPLDSLKNSSQIKNSISDFNSKFFPDKKYQVTDMLFANKYQLFIVKSMGNASEGINYYKTLLTNKKLIPYSLHSNNVATISPFNFSIAFKENSLSQYFLFFKANYLN